MKINNIEERISIKTLNGTVLFSYTCENNSFKKTLIEAIKQHVSLRNANLSYAVLRGVDLSNANLSYAVLRGVDLSNSNLYNSDLCGANLSNAYLNCVDLHDANLRGAILRGADLSGAKNVPYIPMNLSEGEFIAYKTLPNCLIVKLKILEDSKRSRATTDKCRCDKALVLEFQNLDGSISNETEYTSYEYAECKYKIGEIVEADEWDEDRWNECSHGIHFFLDRQTAVNY